MGGGGGECSAVAEGVMSVPLLPRTAPLPPGHPAGTRHQMYATPLSNLSVSPARHSSPPPPNEGGGGQRTQPMAKRCPIARGRGRKALLQLSMVQTLTRCTAEAMKAVGRRARPELSGPHRPFGVPPRPRLVPVLMGASRAVLPGPNGPQENFTVLLHPAACFKPLVGGGPISQKLQTWPQGHRPEPEPYQ